MRPIKFRAWDKNLKKFWYQFEVSSLYGTAWFSNQLREDWVLMQYTGLKDKNGKEIFEGDIVKIDDLEMHYKGSVIFKDGMFCDSYYGYSLCMKDYKIEVIGNIYENGELLK